MCVPITFYLQKQAAGHIWLTHHGLLASALDYWDDPLLNRTSMHKLRNVYEIDFVSARKTYLV